MASTLNHFSLAAHLKLNETLQSHPFLKFLKGKFIAVSEFCVRYDLWGSTILKSAISKRQK
ncbi:12930_t:CDS:2 [Rhizophagus irregularis]|nr:12930_t:CDS:2 [Rhizophagus irregularis]